MGHDRYGNRPRTVRWNGVAKLIAHDGSVADIADQSMYAAKTGLERIPDDLGFTQTLTHIFEWADALLSRDPKRALIDDGFSIPNDPSWRDLLYSLRDRIDQSLQSSGTKSDVAEIAQNAFVESIASGMTKRTADLFEWESSTSVVAVRDLVKGRAFGTTMHEFYASFVRRYLSYYLSRELSNHVGWGERFSSTDSHREFRQAFDTYVRQTIRIADEFTPGWFGKVRFQRTLTQKAVGGYARVALKKIVGEFERGAGRDG